VKELVADKGYHDNRLLAQCAQWQVRTEHRRERVANGDTDGKSVDGSQPRQLKGTRTRACLRAWPT
jgi:hypothetical protein